MQASRRPRRRFAAPLVMTTIAAVPACIFGSGSPSPAPEPIVHRNPPQPVPPDPTPTELTEPTEPAETEPVAEQDRQWTVHVDSTGACRASMTVQCPQKGTCNPPPPRQVDCPDGIEVGKPLTIVAWEGQAGCYILPEPVSCPKDATCNPPPPRRTACPT
jgi:hypothetical protein